MPLYTFKNTKTEEIFEKRLRLSEYDQFLKDNPEVKRHFLPNESSIVSGVSIGTKLKPDSAFREKLKGIKDAHRGSNINTF